MAMGCWMLRWTRPRELRFCLGVGVAGLGVRGLRGGGVVGWGGGRAGGFWVCVGGGGGGGGGLGEFGGGQAGGEGVFGKFQGRGDPGRQNSPTPPSARA